MTEPQAGLNSGEPPIEPFSWSAWLGGFFVALIVGLILNFVVGFLALATQNNAATVLIELIPGGLIAFVSFRWRKEAFPQGAMVGAAIVAITGGLCGASLGS